MFPRSSRRSAKYDDDGRRTPRRGRLARRLRPGPELLETRLVLSKTYYWSPWDSSANNTWDFIKDVTLPNGGRTTATNWVDKDGIRGIPGSDDDAVIESGISIGGGEVKTLSVSGSATLELGVLHVKESVTIDSPAKILVQGRGAFSAYLQTGEISGSGDIQVLNASLIVGAVGTGIRIHGDTGPPNFSGVIDVGANGGEIFPDIGGQLAVQFDPAIAAGGVGRNTGRIHAREALLTIDPLSLINDGTIEAEGASATVFLGSNKPNRTFQNRGLIASSGKMTLSGSWVNSGSGPNGTVGRIEAYDGGLISLAGTFSLDEGSVVTSAAAPPFTGAGAIQLEGTWDNQGRSRTFDDQTGSLNVLTGTILGGTVSTRGSAIITGSSLLDPNALGSSLTLVGVTLDGTIDTSSATARPGPGITVQQGLTLTPEAHILLGSDQPTLQGGGQIVFDGSQTLAGDGGQLSGEIRIRKAGARVTLMNKDDVLTIGRGVTIHGVKGEIVGDSNRVLHNQGTIAADDGGSITIKFSTWTNDPGGVLKAANNGSLITMGNWTQAGQFVALGATSDGVTKPGTLSLGGTFKLLSGWSASTADGQVAITGTLENDGDRLELDQSTGSWMLKGGTIHGGTVRTANGIALIGNGGTRAGGTLDGVTIEGTLQVGAIARATLTIKNNLTLNGKALLGSPDDPTKLGNLIFEGDQKLGGAGEVHFFGGGTFDDELFVNQVDIANGTLTILEGILIHGTQGSIAGSFINRGTISADVSGGMIQVSGGSWPRAGRTAMAPVPFPGPWKRRSAAHS